MAIADLITSAVGGGLFGILGTVANRVGGYFEKKQEFVQETRRWDHEKGLLELQMKAKTEETEQEIQLADTHGGWEGLKASLEAESSIGDSYKWVNAVRALTRPALTLILWFLVGLVYITTQDQGLWEQITETITFAATAATLWWFGDRTTGHASKRGK